MEDPRRGREWDVSRHERARLKVRCRRMENGTSSAPWGVEIVRMHIKSCCEREGCTCSLAVGEEMAKMRPCGCYVIPCFSSDLGEVCRVQRFVKTSRSARIRTQHEDLIRTTSLVPAKTPKLLNPSKPSLWISMRSITPWPSLHP